jgi:hypothetical protein
VSSTAVAAGQAPSELGALEPSASGGGGIEHWAPSQPSSQVHAGPSPAPQGQVPPAACGAAVTQHAASVAPTAGTGARAPHPHVCPHVLPLSSQSAESALQLS